MAQTTYNVHISRALQNIASRFKNVLIDEAITQIGPIVPYTNTFVAQVDVDSNVSTNNGPVSVIDVQCDYRNVILALNYYITHHYPDLDIKPYPATTPASIMAYCLAMFYGHALLSDDSNQRREPSTYAKDFKLRQNLDRFTYKLRRYPVPPFVVELLKGLERGCDPRKPELYYVHNFTCFDLSLDYGRTPPIMLYLAAHNVIASNPANSPIDTLLQEWFNTEILRTPTSICVSNYLGTFYDQNYHMNWFAHMNTTLFNPVTNRTLTVRPTFMRIPLRPQELGGEAPSINPYVHTLGADPYNLSLVETVLDATAACISASFSNCPQLGSLINNKMNTMIMNHYYQPIAYPTWHSRKSLKAGTSTASSKEAAEKLSFKQVETFPTGTFVKTPANPASIYPQWYMATPDKRNEKKSSIKSDIFDVERDITPDVRHFCPLETSNEAIYSNLVLGRHIEHDELTSASVPQPNPQNTILIENGFFLESAIPASSIQPPNTGEDEHFNIIHRTPHPIKRPAVRIDLIDRSIDRLPRFGPIILAAPTAPPIGFEPEIDIPSTTIGCNSIAFKIRKGTDATSIPTGLRKVRVWSSYRYFNIHASTSVAIQHRKLFLTNFRTMHGTNVTLVETPSPISCIPRS